MGKQQQNDDNFFDNISIDGMETGLLTVDEPVIETKEVKESVEVESSGSGEPEKKEAPAKKQETTKKPPEEKLLTVDVAKGDDEEEEEEQEDEQKSAKDKKGGSAPDEESYSPVYLHAAALQENGVLPNFELDSIKDLEPKEAILKINEHIQNQIVEASKERIDEFKSKYEEPTVKFMEALENGVGFNDLAENYSLEARYNSVTDDKLEEDEELQEAVYKDYLSIKGFSEAKIKKMVDMARDKDELLNESKDGLVEIKDQIKLEREEMVKAAAKEKADREQRNNEVKESINKTVTETKEIIPGMELSAAERKEIIKMMTVPVKYVKQNGQDIPVSAAMELRMKNPVAYEMKLNYFIKNGFFDDNAKFDMLLKKSESKATAKLIEKMNGEKKSYGNPGARVNAEKQKENSDFVFPNM